MFNTYLKHPFFACITSILVGCGGSSGLETYSVKSTGVQGALSIASASQEVAEQEVPARKNDEIFVEFDSPSLSIWTEGDVRFVAQSTFEQYQDNVDLVDVFQVQREPTMSDYIQRVDMVGFLIDGNFLDAQGEYAWEDNLWSGWFYEEFDSKLHNLDEKIGHNDEYGIYHYHRVFDDMDSPLGSASEDLVLVGYAKDGFPLYFSRFQSYKTPWNIKKGTRPSGDDGPGGKFDGTYTRDYEYSERYADLDICNGTLLSEGYAYILTEEFPFVPRCLRGELGPSITKGVRGSQQHGLSNIKKMYPHPELDRLIQVHNDKSAFVDQFSDDAISYLSIRSGFDVEYIEKALNLSDGDLTRFANDINVGTADILDQLEINVDLFE